MILTCPSCQAQYVVPDGSIGDDGRTVKCTKCAHKWHQSGVDENVIHVEAEIFDVDDRFDDDEVPERFYDPAFDKKSSDGTTAFKSIGFSFFLFFALFLSIFLTGRQYFVETWTPSAKFFDMVGLSVPVPGQGLGFDSVSANVMEIKGESVLIVTGRIDNLSKGDVVLPVLKISGYDDNDWLKDWVIPLGGKIMQQGQSIAFDYQLSDIPAGNEKVEVTFAYQ